MNEETSTLEQHTAGPQSIGYDYQFYYFMFLALELKLGQSLGFEVKDDIHIDKDDGTTILLQIKHSIVTNSDGTPQNLATLDTDVWKTLSNWADFIKAAKDSKSFVDTHHFILTTNKSRGNNEFLTTLDLLRIDYDFEKVWSKLTDLEGKTQDKTIKGYIKNVKSLGKRGMKVFVSKLNIEAGVDSIIQRIKDRIYENVRQLNLIDPIFESLSSNLHIAKYTDIKTRNKFQITFDDFNKKFGKCFKVAFESKPLPPRNLPVLLPDNLEEQVFVKQLLDIGEVISGSTDIRDYTTQMLKFLNDFNYWSDENLLLPTEIEDFKQDSLQRWKNGFKSRYRAIQNRISGGESVEELDDEIKALGIELITLMREQNLSIAGHPSLGIPSSNGHYYALSDSLEIGWHFNWENKYKT